MPAAEQVRMSGQVSGMQQVEAAKRADAQSRGQRDLTFPAADAVATDWPGHARAVALDLGLAGIQVVVAAWAELQVVRSVRISFCGHMKGLPFTHNGAACQLMRHG